VVKVPSASRSILLNTLTHHREVVTPGASASGCLSGYGDLASSAQVALKNFTHSAISGMEFSQ
jgi:hypothetical protein